MMKVEVPEQLGDVVRAGVKANREVEGSIAVGGTVCALFAHHRLSTDIDFVLSDMRDRFAEIREHLQEMPEWKEAMVRAPVLILGSLDGIEIGYRQLRRSVPIEMERLNTPIGELIVPTLPELIRTKAFLTYNRGYTRDFFDFAELTCFFEIAEVVGMLSDLDKRFAWEKQPTIVVQVIKSLLAGDPHDLYDDRHGFHQFKLLHPQLKTWEQVRGRCEEIGRALALSVLTEKPNETSKSER